MTMRFVDGRLILKQVERVSGRRGVARKASHAMVKGGRLHSDSQPRWVALTITRSPAQGFACKDLGRNGQRATITHKAAYTPIPNRAGSRSLIFGGGLYAGFARY
ncbi:hypothetical protein HMPREF0541_02058 [Lacticaseibacillus rhamnosus ATCC 21052]|nr:hypothetical protein HMPREF0541_02058 [Lacticaseibacillus rhamnosus ATCC 21052]